MKKVLIICDTFPPQFAPRMGYLCKFIGEFGWEAYVVSGMRQSTRADFGVLVGYAKETHIIPQKKHRKWNLLHAWTIFSRYDYLRGEYDLRRKALEVANRVNPDVVLACPSGLFPLCSAHYVSEQKKLPLCVDYRDLAEQRLGTRVSVGSGIHGAVVRFAEHMVSRNFLRRRNEILSLADAVSSVSTWHKDVISHWNPNSYLIYNGYDPERFRPCKDQPTDKFRIVYVGTLATVERRDPTFLFQAIKALWYTGEITPETCRIEFYSGFENFRNHKVLSDEIGVSDFVDFKDYVPSSDVPGILRTASVLLVLGQTNVEYEKGIMTTKLFEYLAVNRPILVVPGDRDCKAALLRETDAGLSADTVEDTIGYIRELYAEWQKNGFVKGRTDESKIVRYSRRAQAEQFVKMFEDAIVNHHAK